MAKRNSKKTYENKDLNTDTKSSSQSMSKSSRHSNSKQASRTGNRSGDRDANNSVPKNYDNIKGNDISWYNRVPELYDTATRVPFFRLQGVPFSPFIDRVDVAGGFLDGPTNYGSTIPANVMVIDAIPFTGSASTADDQINRCARNIWSDIYAKTTGAMQFTPSSLMYNIISVQSILANIAFVKKLLGVSQIWSPENRVFPEVFINAHNIDPNSVIGRQDEIIFRLNKCIYAVSTLKMPNFISTFPRTYSLYHNYYMDGESVKDQLISFRPASYAMFNDTDNVINYLAISWADLNNDIFKFIDIIDAQIEALRSSSSFALVTGAIMRTYSDNVLLTLDNADLTPQLPIYDVNINYQLDNMTILPWETSFEITDDVKHNNVIAIPSIAVDQLPSNLSFWLWSQMYHMLNGYDYSTSPEFQMEATRLTQMIDAGPSSIILDETLNNNQGKLPVHNAGLDLVCQARITTLVGYDEEDHTPIYNDYYINWNVIGVDDDTSISGVDYSLLSALMHFRHRPNVYVMHFAHDELADEMKLSLVDGPFKSFGSYTTMDKPSFNALQTAALASIYTAIPPKVSGYK